MPETWVRFPSRVLLVKSDFQLNITESKESHDTRFISKMSTKPKGMFTEPEVKFNAHETDLFTDGGIQSPVVSLAHELDHAHKYFKMRDKYLKSNSDVEFLNMSEIFDSNKDYPAVKKEEKRVTLGYEADIAKKLMQRVRKDYHAPKEQSIGTSETNDVITGAASKSASPGTEKSGADGNASGKGGVPMNTPRTP